MQQSQATLTARLKQIAEENQWYAEMIIKHITTFDPYRDIVIRGYKQLIDTQNEEARLINAAIATGQNVEK